MMSGVFHGLVPDDVSINIFTGKNKTIKNYPNFKGIEHLFMTFKKK